MKEILETENIYHPVENKNGKSNLPENLPNGFYRLAFTTNLNSVILTDVLTKDELVDKVNGKGEKYKQVFYNEVEIK